MFDTSTHVPESTSLFTGEEVTLPAEAVMKDCEYFTVEKIRSQAETAHMYVAVSDAGKVAGTGTIAPFWGSVTESILLTIYVLPELIGQGIGTAIVHALEKDEYFLRAKRGNVVDEACLRHMKRFAARRKA